MPIVIEKRGLEKRPLPIERKRSGILWKLFRPHTLTASFIPVLIGTVFAWMSTRTLRLGLFIAMMAASILIQAATNMFNEYFDYKRGLDTGESVGIAGAITQDGLKARTVFYIAWSCIALAVLLGVYICTSTTWWLALIGSALISVGYFYTGGPYPIAYSPLGELISGAAMGTGIILISYYIQTGTITWNAFLVSVPSLILIGAIMLSNNIRDLDGDRKGGRHTLAILLGQSKAIQLLAGMFVFSYGWIVALILLKILPIWSLFVLLSVPKSLTAIRAYQGKHSAQEMMVGMKHVSQSNTIFGALLVIGLIMAILLQ